MINHEYLTILDPLLTTQSLERPRTTPTALLPILFRRSVSAKSPPRLRGSCPEALPPNKIQTLRLIGFILIYSFKNTSTNSSHFCPLETRGVFVGDDLSLKLLGQKPKSNPPCTGERSWMAWTCPLYLPSLCDLRHRCSTGSNGCDQENMVGSFNMFQPSTTSCYQYCL